MKIIPTLKKFIDDRSSWSKLKNIQNSKIVSSTYIWLLIVPLTAKFFSKIESILTLTISGKTYEFDLVLPFTWSAFFFSALSFTLANLIFIVWAPKIIKENKDYGDFTNAGKGEKHLKNYFKTSLNEEWIYYLRNNKHKTAPDLKEWFWKTYKERDRENSTARCYGLLFYMVGITLFSLIALQNFWWVINEVF